MQGGYVAELDLDVVTVVWRAEACDQFARCDLLGARCIGQWQPTEGAYWRAWQEWEAPPAVLFGTATADPAPVQRLLRLSLSHPRPILNVVETARLTARP